MKVQTNEPGEGTQWLDAVHGHYLRQWTTPVDAAVELLLGNNEPERIARAINRRGRKIGDAVMATTTPADVADAVEELIELGFLHRAFAFDHDTATEHVLELQFP